jgi:carbonic anhydrase
MHNSCCGQAQSPVRVNNKVRTLVISCVELEQIPSWTVRRHLGSYMVIRTPGGLLELPGSDEDMASLEQILIENTGIQHFVVCLHSLCTKFDQASALFTRDNSLVKSRRFQNLRKLQYSLSTEYAELTADHRKALLQQRWLCEILPKLRQWLKELRRDDVELHGWIYEPETDWISALDTECGLFVPLNAYSKFCNTK